MNISIPLRIKENPEIFQGKKIFIIGDIAFDHSYYCKPSQKGFHAYHANEQIFDIEPDGDDHGSVGSANNISLFTNSFKADSFLLTVTGKDDEGKRVKQILKENGVRNKCIELEGVQTITRLRFFIFNEETSTYQLAYRMDKEPNYSLSYEKSLKYIQKNNLIRDQIEREIKNCDVLILNDTEKGFVSEKFAEIISEIVIRENDERKLRRSPEIKIIADPKNHWKKFQSLPGVIIKPNLKETIKELEFSLEENSFNPENPAEIKHIAFGLMNQYGRAFRQYIITLGRFGVLYINIEEDNKINLYRLPAFHPKNNIDKSAAHCGDIYSAALGLGLSLNDEDIFSCIYFANWVAFLQYNKYGKEKAGLKDILDQSNFDYLLANRVQFSEQLI